MILDSSVGRVRVGCWQRVWVGATTQRATARKEKQRPQTRCQRHNRSRSAFTQKVNAIEVTFSNQFNALSKFSSGQLRNLG